MNRLAGIIWFLSLSVAQTPVWIESHPQDAMVLIDGLELGRTPVADHLMSPGSHTFELILEGYVPVEKTMEIQTAKRLSIDFQLNKLVPIVFRTDEKGLEFRLNGKHKWQERKIRLRIEEGEHELEVYENGELIDSQILEIRDPMKYDYKLIKGTVKGDGK